MMMKSKKGFAIGLDMDGVIIDNTDTKIRFAKRMGFTLKPEQTHAELIEKALTPEVLSELRTHIYFNPVTALQAKLVPGSLDGLHQLKKSGQRFYLISKRKYPIIARELLKKHKLWGKYFDEKNAFFVRETEEKDYHIDRLGIGLYLDGERKWIREFLRLTIIAGLIPMRLMRKRLRLLRRQWLKNFAEK